MSDQHADTLKRRREESSDPASNDGSVHVEKKLKLEPGSAASSESTAAATNAASATTTTTPAEAAASRKRSRWSAALEPAPTAVAAATPPSAATSSSSSTAVQSATEKAAAMQKSIAARIAALKDKVPKLAPGTTPSSTAVKLESSVTAVPSVASFPSPSVIVKDESKAWVPLRLDAQGRPIDEKGNVIEMQRPTELKANLRAKEEGAKPKEKLPHAKIATTIYKEEGQSKFFDPRMHAAVTGERKARSLDFVKPGKYIAMAASMRKAQFDKELQQQAVASAGSSSSAELHSAVEILKMTAPPAVEWWDARILRDASVYPSTPLTSESNEVLWDRITSYVYHPVEVDSLTSAPAPPPMPVLLTKKERLKIKKRAKREAIKEQRDRVRLGIEAPAEPKMRISNLMNSLLNDTVANPSEMDAKVRAQMAARVEGHLEANASRKLTREQKQEKRRRKFEEDTSHEVHVAVYRTGDLTDGATRYKIDKNSQQWNLNGVGIVHPDCSVVVAEGGPNNLRRFRRLMLHRIEWKKRKKNAMEEGGIGEVNGEEDQEEEEDSDDSDDDDDSSIPDDTTHSRNGACHLIWSGVVAKSHFPARQFTFENCRSEIMARNYLQRLGIEQYWDMSRAFKAEAEV